MRISFTNLRRWVTITSLIFILFSGTACSLFFGETTLKIINKSKITLDSVIFRLNNYEGNFVRITSEDSATATIKKYDIEAKHDVEYTFVVYSNNKQIAKQVYFSNDLGYVPDKMVFAFNDSLKLIELPRK